MQKLELAAAANPYARFAVKQKLVDRDLSKAVVMIIPYGAGEAGYTKAVRKRIRARMFPEKKSFRDPTALGKAFISFARRQFPESFEQPHDDLDRLRQPISEHLSALAFEIASAFAAELNEHFPAIRTFKKRLLASASVVWSHGTPMMWQAPSRLPVMQRNFKVAKVVVDSRISSAIFGTLQLNRVRKSELSDRIKFTTERISSEVDGRDQASAMLPNLIHSLDCAHLILTIQQAKELGVNAFSVIHDSYGTHVSDMPILARCIRQAFVKLYSSDSISLLARFEQWCAVLGIASSAPHIPVDQFEPYIRLTAIEKSLYDLAARWAGRDSQMINEMSHEAPKLIERLAPKRKGLRAITSPSLKRLLVFAADRIELEWPAAEKPGDLKSVLESEYFFC